MVGQVGKSIGHDVAEEITAEFTIEPFIDGAPGPHVQAAIDVVQAAGLAVEVGPFGTSIKGATEDVLRAVGDLTRAAISHGATRLSLQLTVA